VSREKPDFLAILRLLTGKRVDFIVVGGVGAVLQGAPVATFDLDLVHSRTPQNIERLLAALEPLEARFRDLAGRGLKPASTHLASPGHLLLMTRFGPLDLLGEIGAGRGYEALLAETVEMELGAGQSVRVLDLPALIRTKEEAGREKDRAVLAILRRTLEERSRKGSR
jgi:hypothetical protein